MMEAPQIVIHGADGDDPGPGPTLPQPAGCGAGAGLAVPAAGMDKYTAGIELSNACRDFYVSRLQAAESMHRKLFLTKDPVGPPGERCGRAGQGDVESPEQPPVPVSSGSPSLDKAMVVLRKEMVGGAVINVT